MRTIRGELQLGNLSLLCFAMATCIVLAAVTYVSLTFSRFDGFYTTIWFGNALALVAARAVPKRHRLIVTAAALLGIMIAGVLVGDPPVRRIGLLASDAAEIAILLYAADAIDVTAGFTSTREFFTFFVRGVLAGPALTVAVATSILAMSHTAVHPVLPLCWYASDVLGILLLFPMWLGAQRALKKKLLFARISETLAIYALVAVISYFAFCELRLPLLFCVLPLPIYAAFRLSLPQTMGTVCIVTAFSVGGTMAGRGTLSAFTETFLNERICILQGFLFVTTVLTLLAHIMLHERNAFSERLEAATLRRRMQADDRIFVGETSQQLQTIFDQAAILRCAVMRISSRYVGDCAAFIEIDDRAYQANASGTHAAEIPDHHPFPMRRIIRDAFAQFNFDAPQNADAVAELGYLFAPLVVERKAVGLLAIQLSDSAAQSERPTQRMIDEMASVVSAGLDTAEFVERDRKMVKTLQRELLPPFLPQFPGVTVDALYIPPHGSIEIGGDWYDVGPLSDGRIYFSIGDVCGHGIPAAGLMGKVRATLKSIIFMMNELEPALRQMDYLLREFDTPTITVCCGILDPEAQTLTYVNAGHPPLLVANAGVVRSLDGAATVPLGLIDELPIPTHTVELKAGSMIVAYTDGLLEAERDVVAAELRLAATLRRMSLNATVTAPADALRRAMLDKVAPTDDTAILVLSVAPIEADYSVRLRLSPTNARALRRRARLFAARHGMDPTLIRQLDISIGEALINVIEHAYDGRIGEIEFRCERVGHSVFIGIADFGAWRPERNEGRGHGFTIMRDFCDRTILSRDEGGTTVEFRVPLHAAWLPA